MVFWVRNKRFYTNQSLFHALLMGFLVPITLNFKLVIVLIHLNRNQNQCRDEASFMYHGFHKIYSLQFPMF